MFTLVLRGRDCGLRIKCIRLARRKNIIQSLAASASVVSIPQALRSTNTLTRKPWITWRNFTVPARSCFLTSDVQLLCQSKPRAAPASYLWLRHFPPSLKGEVVTETSPFLLSFEVDFVELIQWLCLQCVSSSDPSRCWCGDSVLWHHPIPWELQLKQTEKQRIKLSFSNIWSFLLLALHHWNIFHRRTLPPSAVKLHYFILRRSVFLKALASKLEKVHSPDSLLFLTFGNMNVWLQHPFC